LVHFPHCGCTQEIRELFKLKMTTFLISGFCEDQLSYLEASRGQTSIEGVTINFSSILMMQDGPHSTPLSRRKREPPTSVMNESPGETSAKAE